MKIFSLGEKEVLVQYHISMFQLKFLLKLIVQVLLKARSGFVLHTSAVSDNKYAYLFLGPNGAGKSTIVANLKSIFTPFADDTVIAIQQHNWMAYQFPLEKKIDLNYDTQGKIIKALCFVKKYHKTKLIKLSPSRARELLLKQIVTDKITGHQLRTVLKFVQDVPNSFLLYCEKNPDIQKIQSLFISL